jgi:hypothetical protein
MRAVVSRSNEKKAVKALQRITGALMRELVTTAADDAALLNNPTSSLGRCLITYFFRQSCFAVNVFLFGRFLTIVCLTVF